MALRATALGCTHIAASAWFTVEGTTRWGEPREQDKASAGGSTNATEIFQKLGLKVLQGPTAYTLLHGTWGEVYTTPSNVWPHDPRVRHRNRVR